jgi:copper chaperone
MESITIKIKGMTCGGCVASVQRALKAIDGVHEVKVSLEQGQASIDYTPGRVNAARLSSAIEDAGFEVVR